MNYKFFIKNEEHYKEVVAALEALGCSCYLAGPYINDKHIFSYDSRWMLTMTSEIGEYYFKNHKNIEAYVVNGKITTEKPLEGKRTTWQQLVDKIIETSPGAKEVVEMPVAPPVGLRPRSVVEQQRLLEIFEAMHRYVQVGKEVPIEWRVELDDLLRGENYVI